jgi:hypothetical protein
MDLKALNNSTPFTVFPATKKIKELASTIEKLLSSTNLIYGKEVVYTNPQVDNDERVMCLSNSFEKEKCDSLPFCKRKKSNPYIQRYQLPIVARTFVMNLQSQFNSPDIPDERKKELIDLYNNLFVNKPDGTVDIKSTPEEFCEHKNDFTVISEDGLLQLPPVGGEYYHLRGIYQGVGLTKCAMLAPRDDPSTIYITFKPFNMKLDTFGGILESATTAKVLLCDNQLVEIYDRPFTMFGHEYYVNSSFLPFKEGSELDLYLRGTKIHKGLLDVCMKIFEDEKFQNTLKKAILYEVPERGTGWAHSKIVVLGYSLGGAMTHVMTYLLNLLFLPFLERFITIRSDKPQLNCATFGAPRTGNTSYDLFLRACNVPVLNIISSKVENGVLFVDPATCFPKTSDSYVNIGTTMILIPPITQMGNILIDRDYFIMNHFNYQRDCNYAVNTVVNMGANMLPGFLRNQVQKVIPAPIQDEGAENWGPLHNLGTYLGMLGIQN